MLMQNLGAQTKSIMVFSEVAYKQKGRENLPMCCNVSDQSWTKFYNITSRGERKGFALEKSAEFIGFELL